MALFASSIFLSRKKTVKRKRNREAQSKKAWRWREEKRGEKRKREEKMKEPLEYRLRVSRPGEPKRRAAHWSSGLPIGA